MSLENTVLKNIKVEIKRRVLTSFLDLLILRILSSGKQGIGGYDVVRYMQLHYNVLPSSGTVYSCLYTLERRGLIKGRQNGRKRVYILTPRGERMLRAMDSVKNELNRLMSKLFRVNPL